MPSLSALNTFRIRRSRRTSVTLNSFSRKQRQYSYNYYRVNSILTFWWLLQMVFRFQMDGWMLLWLLWCDGWWLLWWWLLLLLLLLLLWWWWAPAPPIVPFPMCNICACPFKLFVIVCCWSVEPIAAARAVSNPVVLVVHIDIIHWLHFDDAFFVLLFSYNCRHNRRENW